MKSVIAIASACLLLTACGRQESVDDLPSSEQLANAANAEIAAETRKVEKAAAENRNYVNSLHGFSITMPEGWIADEAAATPEGAVYKDPGAGADIRISWSKNDGDRDLQQVVEAINAGSEAVDGDFVGENEYRGTANDGEGNSVAVRLIRKADGSLVTATFVYPEMLSEQYGVIGGKTLETLRVFGPAAAEPAPAGNASNAVR